MLRWRSSVEPLGIFLVLLSIIRARLFFLPLSNDAVQVSPATAFWSYVTGRQRSKGKNSSTKVETEDEQPQSRPR